MEKVYCSKCMLFSENNKACLLCGNSELIRIRISVQNQEVDYVVEE